ncbi:MAG: transglycosylase SLT domain-containing protein [Desulfobulbaceae bacterium]|nr:transglycosylase SLT domain-containing protein [Desulfobulbaceae bacterium]
MTALLFRYGFDILIFGSLAWRFVVTGRTKAKKCKRKLFLLRRVLPITLAAFLLSAIVIPGVLGPVSRHARYFPQLIEAHKLRLYWQIACLAPGVSGSDTEIQRAIDEIAREYTMHADLIRAVVRVESSNNQFALSKVGGCGLMQVMPNTYYSLRRGNPFAVRSNLSAGTMYLRSLYRRFDGNVELAIAAYNVGPGEVARRGTVPPGEVRRYVDKVMWWYGKYRG